jgi:hypothetical protein
MGAEWSIRAICQQPALATLPKKIQVGSFGASGKRDDSRNLGLELSFRASAASASILWFGLEPVGRVLFDRNPH